MSLRFISIKTLNTPIPPPLTHIHNNNKNNNKGTTT